MLYSSIFAGLFIASAAAQATCNRDNCFRAVARRSGSGVVDCNSFLATTVTSTGAEGVPSGTATATATSTVTETVTSAAVGAAIRLAKRQAGGIPAYAATCSVSSRYASACLCNGATRTQVTVFQPGPTPASTTTTTTVLTTVTTTTTPAAASPTFAFNIRISEPANLAGQVATTQLIPGFGNRIYFGDSTPSIFRLTTDGVLTNAGGNAFALFNDDAIVQFTAPPQSELVRCTLVGVTADDTTTQSGAITCRARRFQSSFDQTVFDYVQPNPERNQNNGLYLTLDGGKGQQLTLSWTRA